MLNGRNSEDELPNLGRDTVVDIVGAVTNNEGLTNAIDQFIGGSRYNTAGVMEYFVCVGCIIEDVNYDTLDYSSSAPVTMKVTIKPDNVVQYDNIEQMYSTRINSLLPDSVNKGLDIIDRVFGQIGL